MTPDLPSTPVPETTPSPSPDTHYSIKIDKKVVFMGIVILALLGIIASMQFCSNKKIEQAIQHLDSAHVSLTKAQKSLDSTQKMLDYVSKHITTADKQIDNSGAIISGITVELYRLQDEIVKSNQKVYDLNQNRIGFNKSISDKIAEKDKLIRELQTKLNHQNP